MADGLQDASRHAGQVVRRVLLRRNIAIDLETAQLVADAVQAALRAGAPARPPRQPRRVPPPTAPLCSDLAGAGFPRRPQDDGAPGDADELPLRSAVASSGPVSLPAPDSLAGYLYETTLPQVSGPRCSCFWMSRPGIPKRAPGRLLRLCGTGPSTGLARPVTPGRPSPAPAGAAAAGCGKLR